MDKWLVEWIDMMNGWIGGWMVGWMDGWDEWLDCWMCGWMGWVDRCEMDIFICSLLYM